jgi:hypothetical protein
MLPRRDGLLALASAVTFTLQLFGCNGGGRDYVKEMKKRRALGCVGKRLQAVGIVAFLQASSAGDDVARSQF